MPTSRLYRLSAVSVLMLIITALPVMQTSSAQAAQTSGNVWGKDYFPNVPLIDQDGKTLHFFDDVVKDKVVMINMIFTRCPDVCPLETARLLEVQKILGDRVGKDVFMYSISIDPEYDTPKVLKEYAKRYKVGPGWTFLTGKKDDITLIRRKLGMYDEEVDNDDLSNHGVTMIMGNQRTGQWMKASPFENPYVLATKIGSWLHSWKLPPRKGQGYANAPKLRSVSMGETLFRTRCKACHTIGAPENSIAAKRAIGPDLLNVTTTRDKAWLTRWLAETDKMLEEKDPLAMSLFNAYNNVPMPNFHLTEVEIESLITYMEEESTLKNRQQNMESKHHHGESEAHGHGEDGGHQHPSS